MYAWGMFDSALLSLNQGSGTVVNLKVNPEGDIPPWETLPYECVDEMITHLLPKCATARIVFRCNSGHCGLHDSGRWHLQTGGTAQNLFRAIYNWISPIKYWHITLQSTFESLEEFLYETHSLWEKVSSIFILSVDARLRDVLMDICVEGLGKLTLYSSKGILRLIQLPSLRSNLLFCRLRIHYAWTVGSARQRRRQGVDLSIWYSTIPSAMRYYHHPHPNQERAVRRH